MNLRTFPLFLVYISSAFSTLNKVLPILWADTTETLKAGDSNAILAIKFEYPCEKFYTSAIVPQTLEHFTTWCHKEIEDSILSPLENMCKPSFAEGRRRKRGVSLSFVQAIPAVASAVSSVIGLFSKPNPPESDPRIEQIISTISSLSRDIQNLDNKIAIGEARTAELENKVAELTAALNSLEERLRDVEFSVEELQQWRQELSSTLGPTMTLVAKLAAYFQVSKSNINEASREWREGRLSLKLFDVFMMGTNYSLIDVFKGSTPNGCHIDARNGVAWFNFRKNNTDFGVHVLQAFPFEMSKRIEGTDLGWKLEYVGPKLAAYDALSDCIVPYSGGSVDILLFPGEQVCLPSHDLSIYKYWRKSCEHMYYVDEREIQIKAISDSYHIYCYGFEIKLYKSVHKCPNYVFSVNNKEKIEIMSGGEITKILQPGKFEPAKDFHSTKTVYHLMPKIAELDMESFPLSNSCPVEGLAKGLSMINDTSFDDGNHQSTLIYSGFAIVGIAIIFLVISGFLYIRAKNRYHSVPRSGHYSNRELQLAGANHG